MPTYVVMYQFTEQGRKHIKESVRRAQEARELNETAGFNVVGVWWTQGRYDIVAVVETPSEEAMVSGLFNVAETGNVVSETMRAFTADEIQRVIGP